MDTWEFFGDSMDMDSRIITSHSRLEESVAWIGCQGSKILTCSSTSMKYPLLKYPDVEYSYIYGVSRSIPK